MRRFDSRELREAKAYAAAGGQALHVHRFLGRRSLAPRCFVEAFDRGEDLAHLFDHDADRLIRTARELGVRVVVIEDRFGPAQHVDLCGGPLRRALALCDDPGNLFDAEDPRDG